MYYHTALLLALFGASFFLAVNCQTTEPTDGSKICNKYNATNCTTCLSRGGDKQSTDFRCYWCGATKACTAFQFTTAIPLKGLSCPSIRYNVATCKLEVLFIIIIIAVCCLLFILLSCCCCCVCCIACANRRKRLKMVEENRYLDEKDNIRARGAERRAERKAKHDEIRRKYGEEGACKQN